MKRRVAVTGASGFIGGRIARALHAAGHDVRSFGRRPAAQLTDALPRYETWDITDGPIPLADVDVVVHSAAHVSSWGDEANFTAVNVTGTQHVVQSVAPHVRFIYLSSGSIYVDADDPSMPSYGRSKRNGERIALGRDGPTIVLRPRIVYGPGDTTLWPRIRGARRGRRLFVPGNGRNRVSVTHVDHVVHAVERAMSSCAPDGQFDIADDVVPTMDSLLRTMFARHALDVDLVFVPRAIAWAAAAGLEHAWRLGGLAGEPPLTRYAVKNLADTCQLDCSPACQQLGYTPTFSYLDGPLRD